MGLKENVMVVIDTLLEMMRMLMTIVCNNEHEIFMRILSYQNCKLISDK